MMFLRPFLCCGMDEVEDMAEEKVSDNVEEFGSLESKKRYLHLQDNGASETHAEQLSTWGYPRRVGRRSERVSCCSVCVCC